jgi:hypothetical protein
MPRSNKKRPRRGAFRLSTRAGARLYVYAPLRKQRRFEAIFQNNVAEHVLVAFLRAEAASAAA